MASADRETGEVKSGAMSDTQEVVETRCGYGKCRPTWLQVINNPKALCFFLCCFSFVNGFGLNGNNSISTTSYERRFQLSSTKVGWITASSDVSAAVFGIIIAFYGNKRHKPKILSIAFVIASLGYALMFLPHYLTDTYEWGNERKSECSSEEPVDTCEEDSLGLQSYLGMFVMGMLLVGVGGTTQYTVGFALIDDSVQAAIAPIYFSLVGLFILVGAAAGFVIGGLLLNNYVDFDKVPPEEWILTPDDPRWVGAWWVGFLCSAFLVLIVAVPFSAYGAELPTAATIRDTRVSETHESNRDLPSATSIGEPISIRQFPSSLYRLLNNPAFICVVVANCFLGTVTVASATYIPKFVENLFETTASRAALLTGVFILIGAGLGQIFSGVMINRLKLTVRGSFTLLILMLVLAVVSFSGYFLTCDQSKLTGWNSPYYNSSEPVAGEPATLNSTCNQNCHCDLTAFERVCDSAGNAFFSPCLAGCTREVESKVYGDCACLSPDVNGSSVSINNCDETSCDLIYVFLSLSFFSAFALSSTSIQSLSIILRSTHESERTFALGVLNLIARTFGTIPGPVLYGAVVDSSCVLWGESCGVQTSCWLYDNKIMARNLAILGYAFVTVSIAIFGLGLKLYKPPKTPNYKPDESIADGFGPSVPEPETRVTHF